MRLVKNIGLYLTLILGTVLLFIGGKYEGAPRSYMDLWDLGHVLLFTIASYLLIRDFNRLSGKSFWIHIALITILCSVIGIITELIQVNFDRTPDIGDLGRDILGGWIAVVFFIPSRLHIAKKLLKRFKIIVVLLSLLALFPITRSVADEVLAQVQFPLLSDFETRFEIYRWDAYYSKVTIDTSVATSGRASMKIMLSISKYSGIFLKHFPTNWEDYRHLNFSLYNPDIDSLILVIRIHDENHRNYNYHYSDRFNKHVTITSGWNNISIPLQEIKVAPKTRLINLAKIEMLGIFAVNLPQPRTIYIDHVKLTR